MAETFQRENKEERLCCCCKEPRTLIESKGIKCLEIAVKVLDKQILELMNEERPNKIIIGLKTKYKRRYNDYMNYHNSSEQSKESWFYEQFCIKLNELQKNPDNEGKSWDLIINWDKSQVISNSLPPKETKCEHCGGEWEHNDKESVCKDCGFVSPNNLEIKLGELAPFRKAGINKEQSLAQNWLGTSINSYTSRIAGITSQGRGHPFSVYEYSKAKKGLAFENDSEMSAQEKLEKLKHKSSFKLYNDATMVIMNFSRDLNLKGNKNSDDWIPFGLFCHLQSEMNAPWSLGDWISKKRTGSKKNSFIKFFKSNPKVPIGIHKLLSNSKVIYCFDEFVKNRIKEIEKIGIDKLKGKNLELEEEINLLDREIEMMKEIHLQPERNSKKKEIEERIKQKKTILEKLNFIQEAKEEQENLSLEKFESHLRSYYNREIIESMLAHLDNFNIIYELDYYQKQELKETAFEFLDRAISRVQLHEFIEKFCLMHCENKLVYIDYYLDDIERKTVPLLWIPVILSLYSAFNKLKNNFERYSSDLEAIKKLIDNEVDFMTDTYDDYQEFTNKFIFIVWDTITAED